MGKFAIGAGVIVICCLIAGLFPHVAVLLVAIVIVGLFLIFGANQ